MLRRIVIIAKEPRPGTVKTRLAAVLGTQRAAALHTWMLGSTLKRCAEVGLEVEVATTGRLDSPWCQRLVGQGVRVWLQPEGDLGARMAAAVRPGADILLLGADCPLIDPHELRRAFASSAPISVGPSEDGGYWGLRVRSADQETCDTARRVLFHGMTWSTSTVLENTLDRCASARLGVDMLALDYDIDEPTDLGKLLADPRLRADESAALSVILSDGSPPLPAD